MIGAVIRSRARMARRDMTSAPSERRWSRHPAVAIVLSSALAWLVFSGLAHVFASLDAAGISAAARTGMLAMALTGGLVALLAFDVDDVVRTMLLDPDLELLRLTPRPPQTLVAIKAFDAAPRTLLPLVVMAAPAVAAYLTGTPEPVAGALVAALALVLLWAMALAGGVALSIALLRVVPARRAREAMSLVSTLVLTLLWIAGALVLPRSVELDPSSAASLSAGLETASRTPGPAGAAARAIAAAGAGDPRSAAVELLLVGAMGLATFVIVVLACRFALGAVIERMTTAAIATREKPARARRPARWRAEGDLRAIVRRDGRMLRRSWTLLGDLLVASALWALLPLAGLTQGTVDWSNMLRLVLVTMTVGLGYEVAARSIPFERRAVFWVGLAPIPPARFCLAKLLGATAISIPIVVAVGSVLIAVRPPGLTTIFQATCLVLGALVLSQATGLWAGATFGDPEWVNPRAMLKFTGRLVTSLMILVQLGAWLVIGFWLDANWGTQSVAPWLSVMLIAWTLSALPVWAAADRLSRSDSRH